MRIHAEVRTTLPPTQAAYDITNNGMKAPSFAYVRPRSVAEVLGLLETYGERAKLLAGGQSLLAALNMRLSSPELLVDITRIPELSGIRTETGRILIGACTTHAEIERSADVARHLPLLAQAAPHIAHVAIRNAGTLGGSVAMADPAAEWPACCVALDADFVIAAKAGGRRAKARDFFKGVYSTDLRANEVLTGIEFSIPAPQHSVFLELARRRGDYAIVGLAAVAKRADGVLTDVRLAYLGAGETPVLARGAMAALEGKRPSADVSAAAIAALGGDLKPPADIYSTAATKLHLARVLTGRALAALAA
jgi:carbon-monoxide dehydrogenase medium subunit